MSNDILGLGNLTKPVEKLIEVVSQGIGTLYKPRAIRNEAKAQADAKIILAEAEAKIEGFKNLGLDRIVYREQQRTNNIDNVIDFAYNELGDDDVSNENIDKDWSTRFFNIVADISNEEMQAIWGKILAEEIKRPKTHSLRLLEVLKNITKEEAEIFVKLSQYAINNDYVLRDFDYLESQGILFKHLNLMKELALINMDNNLVYRYKENNTNNIKMDIFIFSDIFLVSERPPYSDKLEIPIIGFTSIGQQLLKIVSFGNKNIDLENYIKSIANTIKSNGSIKVYYTKDFKLEGDEVFFNDYSLIEI